METQTVKTGLSKISASVTVKLVIIGILILGLLIPATMIQFLIQEREQRRTEVVSEVSAKWGHKQLIVGPVLTIPYRVYYKHEDDRVTSSTRYLNVLPRDLTMTGKIEPESRYRGIYEVIVYTARVNVNGQFRYPDFDELQIPLQDIIWKDIILSVGIADMKGISENIVVDWGNNQLAGEPGVKLGDIIKSGVHVNVDMDQATSTPDLPFSYSLTLKGSDSIQFMPVGKTTKVNMSSPWAHPSFTGEFLPEQREVTAEGFTAAWTVFHLNRNIPQQWIGNSVDMKGSEFGVSLFLPVDEYQKTLRTAKYAILFIALTFAAFFITEILGKHRLHPIQYLLIGLSLCIFYVLLLSFSEHIGFVWSYLISSLGIILLITLYSRSVLRRLNLSYVIAAVLTVLYGYLFFILQQQDYALLSGSIGLFSIVALIMYLTRNIDWYNIDFASGKDTEDA